MAGKLAGAAGLLLLLLPAHTEKLSCAACSADLAGLNLGMSHLST